MTFTFTHEGHTLVATETTTTPFQLQQEYRCSCGFVATRPPGVYPPGRKYEWDALHAQVVFQALGVPDKAMRDLLISIATDEIITKVHAIA
jgi:hypothetical protein